METERLLKLLKEHKGRFGIIGATDFPIYGYIRASIDIDIFIKAEKSNAKKVWKALRDFGYDVTNITREDLLTKKLLIRQYIIETDIHPFVKGITFDEVWKNKVKAKFGNTFVWFASLDDLIKMKAAAGRPKDLEDIKYLVRLKTKAKK